MGRDTLRKLEDQEVAIKQSVVDGKLIPSLACHLWLLQACIQQQKEINVLKEKLNERTNMGL